MVFLRERYDAKNQGNGVRIVEINQRRISDEYSAAIAVSFAARETTSVHSPKTRDLLCS